jgi:glutathione S-transferase
VTTTESAPPHLVHFRISHYNEKVRWALDYKRWPHTREALVPGLHVPRVRGLTGQNQVPVLVLDGKPIAGSAAILEEIERRRPEPRLFPERPEDRARAMELQRYFDDEVGPYVRAMFWHAYLPDAAATARMTAHGASPWAERALWLGMPVLRSVFRANVDATDARVRTARERLPAHFDHLEREIGSSGFLVGDSFSIADVCAAAMMTAILRPPGFPYALPEPWPRALVELRESVAERAGAQWVARMYREHRSASSEIVVGATRA